MYELKQSNYNKINNLVSKLRGEMLWINSILERNQGKIFVDDINNPETAIIWHRCRNSIVVGKYNEEMFKNLKLLLNNQFEANQNQFALSVVDKNWEMKINEYLLENKEINKYKRKAFRFNLKEFQNIRSIINEKLKEIDFRRINNQNYKELKFKYMPDRYWNSIEEFLNNGMGFSIYKDEKHIAIAFSGSFENNECDIGVETIEGYKGKGYATFVSARIIDYCLENNIEPVWGCRSDNISSIKVAKKLGFEEIMDFAYYIKGE